MDQLSIAMRVTVVTFAILATRILLEHDIGRVTAIVLSLWEISGGPVSWVGQKLWLIKFVHFRILAVEPTEIVVIVFGKEKIQKKKQTESGYPSTFTGTHMRCRWEQICHWSRLPGH